MKLSHILLAVLVAVIWGLNFIFVKIGLGQMSPFMLCSVRFILASIPFVFFIKRPAVAFRWVVIYGMTMFALQFSFLFMGIHAGVSPGLASLILQVQVFFSTLYAAILWDEMPSISQVLGALISFAGIGLVAMHLDNGMTLSGFIFVLVAAAVWGMGNVITKSIGKVNIISLVVWGSFVASIPMILLTLLLDGTDGIIASYYRLNWQGVFSVLFIVYGATWVGYSTWSWLLNRYNVGTVVPFTLLVPIFGILSSVLILGEPFQSWKLWAGILVIGGLCVNLLGARYFKKAV